MEIPPGLGPFPVQAAYDLSAPYYDDWSWQKFWRIHEFPLVKDVFDRLMRGRIHRLHLLDVGCGTGWYLEELAEFTSERVGVDVSSGMLAIARHRLPRTLLMKENAEKLSFVDQRFDVVMCTRVLSHLEHIQLAVREMRRTLQVGGTLILSDVDAAHDYEHTRLPIEAAKIRVDTFKHRREDVFRSIEALGFVEGHRFVILQDGSAVEVKRSSHLKFDNVVGWVGSWRKASISRQKEIEEMQTKGSSKLPRG